MQFNSKKSLEDIVDKKNTYEVLGFVKNIFISYYNVSFDIVEETFLKILSLYNGSFPGYQQCNTKYHDLYHTIDAFIATSSLIDGYNIEMGQIPVDLAMNALLAALFHDTGYIQEEGDNQGTGAKYTKNHIERSQFFINNNKEHFNIRDENVEVINKLISCTGLTINLKEVEFKNDMEMIAGYILGSADILGQMSDREYLERLLFLYYEFKEAGIAGYETEFDIIKKTLDFYEVIKKRLYDTFNGICDYTKSHFLKRYNVDKNLYMDAINKNIKYIQTIIDDSSTNFRTKLKRGGITDKK